MKSHTWDHIDHLIQARFVDSGSDTAKTVDFHYCRTCSGSRTEKIVKDEYGFITEWLRYEMEGLNHLRIDERYDSPIDANAVLDDNDPWRVQRVYYNGSGQLGQIVKATVWDYTSTPTATDYYYGYDILGNVSVISNNSGVEVDQFEQDAFGNEVESSWSSPAGGITEHLTGKMYDEEVGFYYFHARWYDPVVGRFVGRDKGSSDAACVSCSGSTGDALESFHVSQMYNSYAFCVNNPLKYVDINGRNNNPNDDIIELIACIVKCILMNWSDPVQMVMCILNCLGSVPGNPTPTPTLTPTCTPTMAPSPSPSPPPVPGPGAGPTPIPSPTPTWALDCADAIIRGAASGPLQ